MANSGWGWVSNRQASRSEIALLKKKLSVAMLDGRSAALLRCYEDMPNGLCVPRGIVFLGEPVEAHFVVQERPWEMGEVPFVADDQQRCELELRHRVVFDAVRDELEDRPIAQCAATLSSASDAANITAFLVKSMQTRTLVIVREVDRAAWRSMLYLHLPSLSDKTDHLAITTPEDLRSGGAGGYGMAIVACPSILKPGQVQAAIEKVGCTKRLALIVGSGHSEPLLRVISWHFGKTVKLSPALRLKPKVRRVWSAWRPSGTERANLQFISKAAATELMASSAIYNKHVVDQVVAALGAGRRLLIFSDLPRHLLVMAKQLASQWDGCQLNTVCMPGEDQDASALTAADVIFAKYADASWLPMLPQIDTVVLATPCSEPTPYADLSTLPAEKKREPIIVDMRCDGVPVCADYGRRRDKAYGQALGEGQNATG